MTAKSSMKLGNSLLVFFNKSIKLPLVSITLQRKLLVFVHFTYGMINLLSHVEHMCYDVRLK